MKQVGDAKPDFPECIDNFGFLWFEDEAVVARSASWVWPATLRTRSSRNRSRASTKARFAAGSGVARFFVGRIRLPHGVHRIYDSAVMKDNRILGACPRKSHDLLHAPASGLAAVISLGQSAW